MTSAAPGPNADQVEYWNSPAGRKWIDNERMLDVVLAEIDARLVARADPRPGERVVEIGCGTGATTRALAERVGQGGRVLAVDVSEPLLARARERTAGLPVDLALDDAQTHAFPPGAADLAASRFGVMFFDDPAAAFRNLRGALRSGGRLCFAAWGPLAGNPWFAIPRDAAVARLGQPAPQPPTAPGPLAFADRDHVAGLLDAAGFADVAVEAESVDLVWRGEFDSLVRLATNLGPVARIMRERGGGPGDEEAIRGVVAAGLERFRTGDGPRVPAPINFVSARAP